MLHVQDLSVGYAGGTVLRHLTLTAATGEVHAVIAPNGAGKTTLIHTIAGLLPPASGSIHLEQRDITGHSPARRARAGIGLVPQGRRLFPTLTVAEHLRIAARPGPLTADRVLELLPQLAARYRHRAAQLSGGEQQMLAIARALITNPTLLLLDEPTEGLAPALAAGIHTLITQLADGGTTVLLTAPQIDGLDHAVDRIHTITAGQLGSNADTAPSTPPNDNDTTGEMDVDDSGTRSGGWRV